MADEKNGEKPQEADSAHAEQIHRLLKTLDIAPEKPGHVEWEIHIVPRIFLLHPITGEKIELKPRERNTSIERNKNEP